MNKKQKEHVNVQLEIGNFFLVTRGAPYTPIMFGSPMLMPSEDGDGPGKPYVAYDQKFRGVVFMVGDIQGSNVAAILVHWSGKGGEDDPLKDVKSISLDVSELLYETVPQSYVYALRNPDYFLDKLNAPAKDVSDE